MSWGLAPALLLLPPVIWEVHISQTVKVKSHTLNFSAIRLYRAASHCCSLPHCGCVSHCARLNSFELGSLVSSRAWRKRAAESLWLHLIPLLYPLLFTPQTLPSGRRTSRIDRMEEGRTREELCDHGHYLFWGLKPEAPSSKGHQESYCKPYVSP